MSTPLKRCSRCQRDLPATAEYFHKNRYNKDGFQFLCKECRGRKFGKSRQWSMAPEGFKRCAYCKTELPSTLDYFHGNRANHDGLSTACKQCGSQRVAILGKQKPEISRQAKRKYNKSDKGKDNYKEWRSANIERARSIARKGTMTRRARKLAAGGTHTEADIKQQYATQQGMCYYCSRSVGNQFHVDHVVPLSRSGSNGPENLVIACRSCNTSKGDKLLYTEWAPPNPL